jgi:hypothetical protein
MRGLEKRRDLVEVFGRLDGRCLQSCGTTQRKTAERRLAFYRDLLKAGLGLKRDLVTRFAGKGRVAAALCR